MSEVKSKKRSAVKQLYYVTVKDAGRTGFLLGPYDTHEAALANVEKGRHLANEASAWAAFYAFGTASLAAEAKQPNTVFGKAVSNV